MDDDSESEMGIRGIQIQKQIFQPRVYSEEEIIQARLIQVQYRAYRMRGENMSNRKLAADVNAARVALELALRHKAVSDSNLTRLENLFAISDCPILPDSYYIRTTFDSRPFRKKDLGETLHAFITASTQATRDSVAAVARDTLDACSALADPYKSTAFVCAKSIFRTPHYPLIVGMLPFPNGLRKFTFANTMYFVRLSFLNQDGVGCVSKEHRLGLKKRFNPQWVVHVDRLVMERDVATVDFYENNSFGEAAWIGSLVLAKFICRREGFFVPAISIESMVARDMRSGVGNAMYYYISELLFADTRNIERGYIFAQCLNIPFYTLKMSVDNIGKTLVFQLYNLFASFDLGAIAPSLPHPFRSYFVVRGRGRVSFPRQEDTCRLLLKKSARENGRRSQSCSPRLSSGKCVKGFSFAARMSLSIPTIQETRVQRFVFAVGFLFVFEDD